MKHWMAGDSGVQRGGLGVQTPPRHATVSSHPMLHQPVHRQVMTVRPLTVFQELSYWKRSTIWRSVAVCARDMKMFSVAYVSCFSAKRLLNDSNCDICKKCLISEVPSALDISTEDSRSTAV